MAENIHLSFTGREVTSRDREKLIEHLGFAETLNPEAPLLSEVIKLSKVTVLKSETPTIYDDTSEQSEVSSISAAKTPEPVTKIGSDNNATFTLNSPKEPEQAQKSFLGDLPPLGGSTNRAPLNLAPLKKIPPVAKVEATKKEGMYIFEKLLKKMFNY